MSRRVRLMWRIGGGLVAAGVLVMGVTQSVGQVAHEEYTEEATFDAAGLAVVEVHNGAGSVRIVGSGAGDDTVEVTAEVSDGLRKTGHDERVEGDRLVLDASCPVLSSFCELTYVVEVPSDADLDVVVTSRAGVTASGFGGDIDLVADHGNIEVSDVQGTLRLRSDHGSLSAIGLRSDEVDASTGHGRVELELLSPPSAVRAASSHGSVDVVVPEGDVAYDVEDSRSGEGTVSTPISTHPDSDRPITATSGPGDVTIRYGN